MGASEEDIASAAPENGAATEPPTCALIAIATAANQNATTKRLFIKSPDLTILRQ
jgi:hypothetical protein